jgi:RNA polymerase sigma factor (sigma-70 family)
VHVKVKYSETDLVNVLKSGSQKDFAVIYDYFSHSLYGVIKQIVRDNEELAQDLLQETFVKVWNSASTYSPEKSRLFTWMLNIARNSSIDYIRSKQGKNETKNQSLEKLVGIEDTGINAAAAHEHIGLKKIVNELKPEYKEIIDLAYFEGYTQDQIAKKLQMPLGTVKTRSRAALQILRKTLNV